MRHACAPWVAGIPPGIWNGANPPSVSPPLHVPFPLVRLPSPPTFPALVLPSPLSPTTPTPSRPCRQAAVSTPIPFGLASVPFSLFLSLLSFIYLSIYVYLSIFLS